MDQDKVAGSILLELMDVGIVQDEDQEIVFFYLRCAYAAGYNKGSKARSRKKPVMQITTDGKLVEIYESCADASRRTKVGMSEISKCAIGKAHTAGGYLWAYTDQEDEKTKNSRNGRGAND